MADRTAAAAVRTAAPTAANTRGILQRKCACGTHTVAGAECEACKEQGASHDSECAVTQVLRSPGAPLDPQTRNFFESRFKQNFSGVRVHADSAAADSAKSVHAAAYTVGQHIVLGRGQSKEDKRLLAHELTHVVQQGNRPISLVDSPEVGSPHSALEREADTVADGIAASSSGAAVAEPRLRQREPLLQRDGEADTPAQQADTGEQPTTHMFVDLSKVTFIPATDTKLHEGLSQPQCFAIILKRLLGSRYRATDGLEVTVAAEIEKRRSPNLPPLEYSGYLTPDFVAGEGEALDKISVDTDLVALLVDFLSEKYGPKSLVLSDSQRELIRLSVANSNLYNAVFKQLPPWYTPFMFAREMAQHADLLRQYEKLTTPQDRKSLEDTVVATLLQPVKVMQALQGDPVLAADKDPKAAAAYGALWNVPAMKPGSERSVKKPVAPASEKIAMLFMGYTYTQAEVSQEALTSHDARVMLLHRFMNFMGSVVALSSAQGDEALANNPAKANTPAFPFRLTSRPELQPPLFQADQEAEVIFDMQLDAPTVYDYFAPYGFAWDLLEVPPDKLPKHPDPPAEASKDAVLERERATVKGAGEALKGSKTKDLKRHQVTTGQRVTRRLKRDSRYAAEDMRTLISGSNVEPGVGTLTLAAAGALLRYVGTGIRLAIELITEKRGMLHSVQHVTFPEEGIYFVRCVGFPLLEGKEELVRAPSVAYYPVFARDPKEMALEAAAESAQDQADTPKRIDELHLLLQAPLPAQVAKQYKYELESLEASQKGIGAVYDLQLSRLEQDRFDLQAKIKALKEGKKVAGTLAELEKSLESTEEQISNVVDIIRTRGKRQSDLKNPKTLIGAFVSDEGESITLSLEMVDRGMIQTLKGPQRSVYVSDLTTKDSGADSGEGATLPNAIKDALVRILGSGQGYGRGQASFSLEGQLYLQRIASTEGHLLTEAIENVALALSVAATAAAFFVGAGALAVLIPVGIVGAIPSAYRLAERSRTGTLRMDLNAAMDLVNVAASAVGLGRLAVGAKIAGGGQTALRYMWVGRSLQIIGFGLDKLNIILLAESVIEQLEALKKQPEDEQAAGLLMVLGNVMIQAGMMIGHHMIERADHLSRQAPEAHAPGETAGGNGKTRTAAGMTPPEGKPSAAVEREASIRDVQSKSSLYERFTEEGIRRSDATPGPRPTTTITPENPRLGIKDVHEAYKLYDEALRAHDGKKEVGIFRNAATGEYSVCVGDATSVDAPREGDWEGVLHFHQNPQNAKQFRMPAPKDFEDMIHRYHGGQSVREFLEYEIPGLGRGRTEFGITQGNEKPFYVTVYLPDGSASTFRFANDGTFSSFWGSEKTYVDPTSPLYKAMLDEMPKYLKAARENADWSEPANEDSGRKRTAAGAKPPKKGSKSAPTAAAPAPPATFQDREGVLNDDGVAFLRKRFKKRFPAEMPADAVKEEYRKDPRGTLLEAVVNEEIKRYHSELGRSKDRLVVFKQKMKDLPALLGKYRTVANPAVVKTSVLEFVRTHMADALAIMENYHDASDPERERLVRKSWKEFAWSQKSGKGRGFLMGTVGDKELDAAEFFFDRELAIVTDATHRYNDPIHNFKTLFYASVIEAMTNMDSGSVDYRSEYRQNPIVLGAPAPNISQGTQP